MKNKDNKLCFFGGGGVGEKNNIYSIQCVHVKICLYMRIYTNMYINVYLFFPINEIHVSFINIF